MCVTLWLDILIQSDPHSRNTTVYTRQQTLMNYSRSPREEVRNRRHWQDEECGEMRPGLTTGQIKNVET